MRNAALAGQLLPITNPPARIDPQSDIVLPAESGRTDLPGRRGFQHYNAAVSPFQSSFD